MQRFWLAAVFLFLSTTSEAAILQFIGVDYGTPGDPYTNAPLPGQSGNAYFTVKNTTVENMHDVILTPQVGTCLTQAANILQIPSIAAGETVRAANPVAVSIGTDPSCSRGNPAEILLMGSYADDSGIRQRVWSAISFTIAPLPITDFRQENLGLPIRDGQTTTFTFTINSPMVIRDIGIFLDITHTYIGDLTIKLISPNGTEVLLWDGNGGSTHNLVKRWGWEGDAFSAMNVLVGQSVQGTWTVTVHDGASGDEGTLNTVQLRAQ